MRLLATYPDRAALLREYAFLEEEDLRQALRYAAMADKSSSVKRVLLDPGLAPLAASFLREEGWDAVHVSEIGLAKAEDAQILDAACQDGRICVTLDHDFHAHLAMTSAGQPSVVLLRVQGLDATGRAALIRAFWKICDRNLRRVRRFQRT